MIPFVEREREREEREEKEKREKEKCIEKTLVNYDHFVFEPSDEDSLSLTLRFFFFSFFILSLSCMILFRENEREREELFFYHPNLMTNHDFENHYFLPTLSLIINRCITFTLIIHLKSLRVFLLFLLSFFSFLLFFSKETERERKWESISSSKILFCVRLFSHDSCHLGWLPFFLPLSLFTFSLPLSLSCHFVSSTGLSLSWGRKESKRLWEEKIERKRDEMNG